MLDYRRVISVAQKKRNPGAIRDLESWINNGNPTFESVTVTGNVVVNGSGTFGSLLVTGNAVVNGNLTVTGNITIAGTQLRNPVQFGPYTTTASSVSLVTDIATWANDINMTVVNISLNGTGSPILQAWTGTGLVTAGYTGGISRSNDGAAITAELHSNGFRISPTMAGTAIINGQIRLQRHGTVTSNTWGYTFLGGRHGDTPGGVHGGGHIVLPSALVKLSVGTATGTLVYDSGEVAGRYVY